MSDSILSADQAVMAQPVALPEVSGRHVVDGACRATAGFSPLAKEDSLSDDFSQQAEKSRLDGFEQGRTEGYQQGYIEGGQAAQRSADKSLAVQSDTLTLLIESLRNPLAAEREALKPLLGELVSRICREVCQRELLADNRCVESIVSQALDALPAEEEALHIFLNPGDLSILESLDSGGDVAWPLRADKQLQRGDCRVVSAHSRVDFFTESRLRDIVNQTFSLGTS